MELLGRAISRLLDVLAPPCCAACDTPGAGVFCAACARLALDTEEEELEGVPLVASQAGAYSRRTLEDACRRAGFEPRVAFDSASPSSVLALGEAGLGIPITIDDAVDQPAGRPWPGIVESGRPIVDTVGLYWRAGAVLSPTARAFVDVARSAADQAQVAISS